MGSQEKPSQDLVKAAGAPNALEAFKKAMGAICEESPEILTGIVGTIDQRLLIPVRMVHATLKGHFFTQLLVEMEEFRKKGQINEDYLKSDHAWACFSDLLDFVDKTSPDPKRLGAIKTAFLKILSDGAKGSKGPYEQQLLRIICGLSAGEIIVLAAVSKMGHGGQVAGNYWRAEVANASGLLRDEIVAEIDEELARKRLITPINGEIGNLVSWGHKNRLTVLGVEVCNFIREQDVAAL